MNAVISSGVPAEAAGESASKTLDIIIPAPSCILACGGGSRRLGEGEAAAVPPGIAYGLSGRAYRVCIDKPMLSLKQPVFIDGSAARGLAFVADEAAASHSNDVLAALGALAVAYIREFCGGDRLTPVVEIVKNDILKNLSDPFYSLGDSLKKLPLSYDYVRKLFKREMGATPHEYLLNSRMELARELLSGGMGNRYSNYSVGQVAEACGFSDPLYFSRVYKKFYGHAPSVTRPSEVRPSGGSRNK